MKKVIITGVIGVFVIAITSCGGGHTCDAYRTSDYTKYKADKQQEVDYNKTDKKDTKK